jgi:hypothetical protein
VILDFFDKGTQDIYNGVNSKLARKTLPVELGSVTEVMVQESFVVA